MKCADGVTGTEVIKKVNQDLHTTWFSGNVTTLSHSSGFLSADSPGQSHLKTPLTAANYGLEGFY